MTRAAALALIAILFAGCATAGSSPAPVTTPEAAVVALSPRRTPVPTTAPKPTAKPKSTPKPLYSVAWLTGACAALGHLGTAVDHLSAVRVYLSSGDWGNIRLEDFSATQETFPAIQALSDDWKPGRGFNSELLDAAIAVQHAASQWDLAATFMTVGTSTDAASATLDAITQANVAATSLAALGKKYHFTCADAP